MSAEASARSCSLAESLARLRAGEPVAFPTETVYGLGADLRSAAGIERVFALKGRPRTQPLIVHLGAAAELARYALEIPPIAWTLAERYWPGPLTLVLQKSAAVPAAATGGQSTVGLRVPAHALALELIRELGAPLAAPSANRHTRVSPTSAEHVRAEFAGVELCVLDGGPCAGGIESTILDLSGERPRLLRPGLVTREELEPCLGEELLEGAAPGMRAPGALPLHYAPRARVELVSEAELAGRARAELAAGVRVGALSLAAAEVALPERVARLALRGPARAQARELYAALRAADEQQLELLLVVLPEARGVGAAVADRLRRAAGRG